MKNILIMAVIVLSAGCLSAGNICFAQEMEPQAEKQCVEGVVEGLSENTIVVSSDMEEGEKVVESYALSQEVAAAMLDPETKVAIGDAVKLEYVVQEGLKVVTAVSKQPPQPQEETETVSEEEAPQEEGTQP